MAVRRREFVDEIIGFEIITEQDFPIQCVLQELQEATQANFRQFDTLITVQNIETDLNHMVVNGGRSINAEFSRPCAATGTILNQGMAVLSVLIRTS